MGIGMGVSADAGGRCVIWWGRPSARERANLAAAGWQLRIACPEHEGIGLRGSDVVVGVIDLRHLDATLQARLLAWLPQYRQLPLFVLVDDDAASSDASAALHALSQRGFVDVDSLLAHLQAPSDAPQAGMDLLGRSPVMLSVHATVHKYAPVDLPVLITGETGTGKELAARALHDASPRHHRPFLALNCGAMTPSLVQSELFGHEKGAFTGAQGRRTGLFEAADLGTVFLDEIGDLPLDAQTNLLRVLQEGTIARVGSNQPLRVDVRIIAATHVDLEHAVEQGRFRRDLFYRLNVLRFTLPPLRERGDDVLLLAGHFLARFRERHPCRAHGFSREAMALLLRHAWPGNVRELLNHVQRAAIIAEGALIEAHDLQLVPSGDGAPHRLEHSRLVAEREALVRSLEHSGYNISACARRMQVSRITVYRLCRKHHLALQDLR